MNEFKMMTPAPALNEKKPIVYCEQHSFFSTYAESLQEVLVENGIKEFKKIEEAAILSVEFNQTVLATGGSAIFSKKAMNHIKSNSSVIYLEVSFEDIMDRIPDFSNRGFIKEADQTMEHAFNERESIYREFADHIVTNNEGLESCFNKILSVI